METLFSEHIERLLISFQHDVFQAIWRFLVQRMMLQFRCYVAVQETIEQQKRSYEFTEIGFVDSNCSAYKHVDGKSSFPYLDKLRG